MTVTTPEAAAIEQTIRTLENTRYAAMLGGDTAAFSAIAHPQLVYTHSNADVDSLASYMAKIASGHYVYRWIDHPVDRMIVAGDTVVVIGEMRAEITAGGVRKTLNNKVVSVWHRTGDQWLLIAFQPTVIPAVAR